MRPRKFEDLRVTEYHPYAGQDHRNCCGLHLPNFVGLSTNVESSLIFVDFLQTLRWCVACLYGSMNFKIKGEAFRVTFKNPQKPRGTRGF